MAYVLLIVGLIAVLSGGTIWGRSMHRYSYRLFFGGLAVLLIGIVLVAISFTVYHPFGW